MKFLRKILSSQMGITLAEMLVVVAIMGVMAGVAVPVATKHLSGTKQRSYDQDLAMIQVAVDSYFTGASNERHLGLRQFPITVLEHLGASVACDDTNTTNFSILPANPARGTRGGEPYWVDNGDGLRGAGEDALFPEATAINDAGSGGFYVSKMVVDEVAYAVDSRGFFIDFHLLVDSKLMKSPPISASIDNGGVPAESEGSYIWYVDGEGQVNSLLASFPYNGLHFTGVPISGALDLRGFQEGVYP